MTAKDPLRYFRVEAREISEALGRGALQIEQGSTPDLITSMMRLAHTLKGAASVVKQRTIADQTHALEDSLAALREHSGAVPRKVTDAILAHVDAIAAQVAALEPEANASPKAAEMPTVEEFGVRAGNLAEMDALLDGIAEATVQVRSMRHVVELAEQAHQLGELIAEQGPRISARARGRSDPLAERLRQDADDLRGLLARLQQSLKNSVDRSERELLSSHAAAERLRLLPCNTAFASLERSVRDAAIASGKRAAMEIKGGDIRLDAQVLGLVQRALVQLLRNAVAHGIETPAERIAASKPEVGAIRIEITRRGDRVVFRCTDDGSGVDLDAVRRVARARGIPPPSADDALLTLLFKGGLSTSDSVTEASGRGIGLEVVRDVVGRLGGEVIARTEVGKGTLVELVVPVSLAALDALLVEAGGSLAAIPIQSVRRAMRVGSDDVARAGDRDRIVYDGATVAFAPLARLMGNGGLSEMAQGPRSTIVVGEHATQGAIGVDRVHGVANIVVRPVPPLAFADPVVAGVYLDAAGIPCAVLNPERLTASALAISQSSEVGAAVRPAPILVIDDSLTTRVLEQSILQAAGYDVELATSAEEALEMARANNYALFLVDVEMPGMDGFTFVEKTRADPELCAIPAILVTSRGSPEDRERGRLAGAHAYVVKSEFDQGKVLAIIRGLLERP